MKDCIKPQLLLTPSGRRPSSPCLFLSPSLCFWLGCVSQFPTPWYLKLHMKRAGQGRGKMRVYANLSYLFCKGPLEQYFYLHVPLTQPLSCSTHSTCHWHFIAQKGLEFHINQKYSYFPSRLYSKRQMRAQTYKFASTSLSPISPLPFVEH